MLATLPFVPSHTGPTPEQLATLQALADYHHDHGHPPSLRDLAGILGIAFTGAAARLRILADRGLIRCTKGMARTATLTPKGHLLADGWELGLHPDVNLQAHRIDRNVCRFMRCGACHSEGLTLTAYRRDGDGPHYAAIVECHGGWTEEF